MPDDFEDRTTDFMHALAASDADVVNISADLTEEGLVVIFDLLDPDDADLVRDVAEEHGFKPTDDIGKWFVDNGDMSTGKV